MATNWEVEYAQSGMVFDRIEELRGELIEAIFKTFGGTTLGSDIANEIGDRPDVTAWLKLRAEEQVAEEHMGDRA